MPDPSPLPAQPAATSRASGPRLARRRFVQLVLGLTGLSAIAALIACQ